MLSLSSIDSYPPYAKSWQRILITITGLIDEYTVPSTQYIVSDVHIHQTLYGFTTAPGYANLPTLACQQ